jgi:transcriptional regulator with PAS, ATPase and Fis domain
MRREINMEPLVAFNETMVRLRDYLPKVARSSASVLITGETGTGKEVVAETIHRLSPRSARPFVRLNCAAIPDNLVESELFGYERGAFTGAQGTYSGKLRLADGGTVLLDEIGEMSLMAQAKLLRVIENSEIFPLAGTRTIPVDVRIIAATNQDLDRLLDANRFRRDLYYRLNVVRLQLPPLRERPEDIPALFELFLAEFNRRYRLAVPGASADLRDCLIKYQWPGNIREMRNLVEAIFIDPPNGPIELGDLPQSFQKIFAGFVLASTPADEREKLLSILHSTNWNKSRAAAQLKWSRMTLYRKLSKYDLGPKRTKV